VLLKDFLNLSSFFWSKNQHVLKSNKKVSLSLSKLIVNVFFTSNRIKWKLSIKFSLLIRNHLTLEIRSMFTISGRVPTVREKSGKNDFFSRSGKSQGILKLVREI